MNLLARAAIVLSSLLVGCAAARGALPNDDGLECFVIKGAEIVPPNRQYAPTDEMTMQEQLAIANQGHEITKGSSTIIAMREFSGRNRAVDGQRYRKLTIKLDSQSNMEGPIDVTESHFVSGSSAFVAWGFYYVSTNTLKAVSIANQGSRRILTVNQEISSFRVPDGVKEDVNVDFKCELKTKNLGQLSAWEGNPETKSDPFYP